MLTILGALFPVFGLIALGFALARLGVLGEEAERQLTRFVASVTLPVLTFHTIAVMNPADLVAPVMAAVVVGASYILYAAHFMLERALGRDAGEANIVALGGCYGNSAFVGLPICLALFGRATLGPSALVMALNSAMVFGGGVFMQVLHSKGGHTAGESLRAVARQIGTNPLIVGALAGAIVSLSGLPLPGPLDTLMATLGGATAGCALIAIGLFIARPTERVARGPIARALVAKLLMLPLVTLGLLLLLPPLDPVWSATALVMAAVPTATSTFVLASQTGRRATQFGASIVTFAPLLAAVTVPGVIAALEMLGMLAVPQGAH